MQESCTNLKKKAFVKYMHLNDSTLGDDTHGSVHGTIRVLLHTDDFQVESALELWMGDMCLCETQSHWPNEAFILGGLAGEPWPNKGHLCHHSLPLLSCSKQGSH